MIWDLGKNVIIFIVKGRKKIGLKAFPWEQYLGNNT